MLQLRHEFDLNCFQQEMVVSSMLMGAVVASLTGGIGLPVYFNNVLGTVAQGLNSTIHQISQGCDVVRGSHGYYELEMLISILKLHIFDP